MTDNDDAWSRADCFRELRELCVGWIRGEVPDFPGYRGSPASETEEIAEALIGLNERGLLTTGSQPAGVGDNWKNRAYVNGFAREKHARRIAEKSLQSDLHILAFPPDAGGGYMTPVGILKGQPCLWNGRPNFRRLERFQERLSEAAFDDLRGVWSVIAIDLEWGRKGHLWEVLLEDPDPAFSVTPAPYLGLDRDFVC